MHTTAFTPPFGNAPYDTLLRSRPLGNTFPYCHPSDPLSLPPQTLVCGAGHSNGAEMELSVQPRNWRSEFDVLRSSQTHGTSWAADFAETQWWPCPVPPEWQQRKVAEHASDVLWCPVFILETRRYGLEFSLSNSNDPLR